MPVTRQPNILAQINRKERIARVKKQAKIKASIKRLGEIMYRRQVRSLIKGGITEGPRKSFFEEGGEERIVSLERLAQMASPLNARIRITPNELRRAVDDIEDKERRYCDICDKDTLQLIKDSGHERDSSNDYHECLTCGHYKTGWSDTWDKKEEE